MLDVMFYEAFEEEEEALRQQLPSSLKADFTWKTIQEKGEKSLPAAIISVRTQSQIPVEWGGQIKGILTRSQGYDHLKAYCVEARQEIPCGYLEEYCSRAVAEHALMAMFFLMRKTKKQMEQVKTFERDGLTGTECLQKKALIIGVGRIGSRLVSMAQGLNMEVQGVDIDPKIIEIDYVSLEEGLSWADIVFCCVPLTGKTVNMLNYDRLSKLSKGGWLINISRGEITPLPDMLRLIEEKKLAGLSLDVYENEKGLAQKLRGKEKEEAGPVATFMKLKEKDNVLLTPHNAFNTSESVKHKALLSMESIITFIQESRFLWPVP